jgi:uncharacterized protein (TIRG00374 family)
MTKDRINAFLKFLFFLSLGIFLIWISTKSLTKEEVETVKYQILAANYNILVPSILIILLSHFMRALRWKMMITPLSYKPSLFNVFLSVLIGFFFNLIFPRLGELMKCTLLGKHEKIPVDKLVGTMVAERLIDVFCLLIVISMTIVSQYQRVGNYANELIGTFYKKIQFNINKEKLSFYNANLKWDAEPTDFDLMIGSSSEDLRLKESLQSEHLKTDDWKDAIMYNS